MNLNFPSYTFDLVVKKSMKNAPAGTYQSKNVEYILLGAAFTATLTLTGRFLIMMNLSRLVACQYSATVQWGNTQN